VRARRGVDVPAAVLAIAGLAACVGPFAESTPAARPTSAAQCIADDEPRSEGFVLRLAVSGRQHTFPADHIVLDFCFQPPSDGPVLVEFELSELDGTVTPMESTIEHPDRPAHMISAVASLDDREGSGQIYVRMSSGSDEAGDGVSVDVSDGEAEVTEE
jgi:hypothetical protein